MASFDVSNSIMQKLISQGKVRTRPYCFAPARPLDVSLDIIATRLLSLCRSAYSDLQPLRYHYSDEETLNDHLEQMVDCAVICLYNRLRSVAAMFDHRVCEARCDNIAPVSDHMEFPSFISSLLRSIGPLRITDGPSDVLAFYVPPAGTAGTYGRTTSCVSSASGCWHLLSALRECNIQLSPIVTGERPDSSYGGSFWTTCEVVTTGCFYDVVGTAHPSHYENEDVLRSLVFAGDSPFQPCGLTVGYVEDEAVVDALVAAAAAPGVPDSSGRPVGMIYDVNGRGVSNSIGSRGCFVIGRGVKRIYSCYLACGIRELDVHRMLSEELTRCNPDPPGM